MVWKDKIVEKKTDDLKVVIIGASAAGLRAAARTKRLLPDSSVIVVDQGKIISYGACGLPYYVSGDIETPRPLRATAWGAIRDAEFFHKVKGLDVRVQTAAASVNMEDKTVKLRSVTDGAKEVVSFDKLVMATGARPFVFPDVSKDSKRISAFKTIQDAMAWRERLETGRMENIAIIGSGFIGIELAEAFGGMWGVEVTLIEAQENVLPRMLDPELSAVLERHLAGQGIKILTGAGVNYIKDDADGVEIETEKGLVKAQYAIVAMGVKPAVEIAREMGLEIGSSGGIVVNEKLQTSHKDVYAAGDCVEVKLAYGQTGIIPLGSLANKQGRVVGDQLAGKNTLFGKVAGSACVKAFDYNIASTGLCQAVAEQEGIEYRAVWGTFSDIAHYHPEEKNIFLKLLYSPKTLKVLGFQAVGPGEVVKRVDVLGNLILNQGTIMDLLDLEFAYSPPFAPALDPLYVLGAAAQNQEDGIFAVNPLVSFESRTILDVRTKREASNLPIEGAVNIPLEELRHRMGELDKSTPVTVICAKGVRAAEAARWLFERGFKDALYSGGGVFMQKK